MRFVKYLVLLAFIANGFAAPEVTCLQSGYPAAFEIERDLVSPERTVIEVPPAIDGGPEFTHIGLRADGYMISAYPAIQVLADVEKGMPLEVQNVAKTARNPRTIDLASGLQKFQIDGPGNYTILIWGECGNVCLLFDIQFLLEAYFMRDDALFAPLIVSRLTTPIDLPKDGWIYFYDEVDSQTKVYVTTLLKGLDQGQYGAEVTTHFVTNSWASLPTETSPQAPEEFSANGQFIVGIRVKSVPLAVYTTTTFYVKFGYETEPIDGEAFEQGSCFVVDNLRPVDYQPPPPPDCDPNGVAEQCEMLCDGKGGYAVCVCGDDNKVDYTCNGVTTVVGNECAGLTGTCRAGCGSKIILECKCANNYPSYKCPASATTTEAVPGAAMRVYATILSFVLIVFNLI